MSSQVIRFLSKQYGAKVYAALIALGYNPAWDEEARTNWLDSYGKELVMMLNAR